MDERTLQKAVDDISFIKEVIDKTGRSFTAFSKIFVYWGILFIINSIATFIINSNKEAALEVYQRYPLLSYTFPTLLIAFAAALIYLGVSRKLPLGGLEKHLMTVWLLILCFNILPRRFQILSSPASGDLGPLTILENHLAALYFSLAIALIVTSLFTGFKNPMYLGVAYIAISLFDTYINLPIDGNGLTQLLALLALPFTFIYTGLYLKSKNLGGKLSGNQLHS